MRVIFFLVTTQLVIQLVFVVKHVEQSLVKLFEFLRGVVCLREILTHSRRQIAKLHDCVVKRIAGDYLETLWILKEILRVKSTPSAAYQVV